MKEAKKEESRLIVSLGILASILAIFTLAKDPVYSPIKIILLMSGVLLFSSIVLSADKLRYKFDRDEHFIFKNGETLEKWRRWFYDWSINVYYLALGGYGILVILSFLNLDLYGASGYSKRLFSVLFDNSESQLGLSSLIVALILIGIVRTVAMLIARITSFYRFLVSKLKEKKKINYER